MKQALFISETENKAALITALDELRNRSHIISPPLKFEQTINFLSRKNIFSKLDLIIINAFEKGFEALELCKYIAPSKSEKLKILVFFPNASLHEASKFGFLKAFTENENTIINFVQNLDAKQELQNKRKRIISVSGISNEIDSSYISLLLSKQLSQKNHKILLLESCLYPQVREILNLKSNKSLIEEKENDTNLADFNWFKNYLQGTPLIEGAYYLALYKNLSTKLEKLKPYSKEKLENMIDLSTDHVDYCVANIGNDFQSDMNRVLLEHSSDLFIILSNSANIHHSYKHLKSFLEKEFHLRIHCIILCSKKEERLYKSMEESKWEQILGEKALIISDLDLRFREFLYRKTETNIFEKDLLELLSKLDLSGEEIKGEKQKWFSLAAN